MKLFLFVNFPHNIKQTIVDNIFMIQIRFDRVFLVDDAVILYAFALSFVLKLLLGYLLNLDGDLPDGEHFLWTLVSWHIIFMHFHLLFVSIQLVLLYNFSNCLYICFLLS